MQAAVSAMGKRIMTKTGYKYDPFITHPDPIKWPPVYEENLNDDENFIIEGVFEHNGGAGRGVLSMGAPNAVAQGIYGGFGHG